MFIDTVHCLSRSPSRIFSPFSSSYPSRPLITCILLEHQQPLRAYQHRITMSPPGLEGVTSLPREILLQVFNYYHLKCVPSVYMFRDTIHYLLQSPLRIFPFSSCTSSGQLITCILLEHRGSSRAYHQCFPSALSTLYITSFVPYVPVVR